MKPSLLLSLIFVIQSVTALAQKKVEAEVKEFLEQLVLVKGGTFRMGGNAGNVENLNPATSDKQIISPTRQITVSSFYLSKYEVTNRDWRKFIQDQKKQLSEVEFSKLLPDTSVWSKQFQSTYNVPFIKNYFQSPEFDNFPVVGISWTQAKAYCEWKTKKINLSLKSQNIEIQALRLPTEAEWEYVAFATAQKAGELQEQNVYAWGNELYNPSNIKAKTMYKANLGMIKDCDGLIIKSLADDGFLYTAPVKSFSPNAWGIYQMGGNVAEWVEDVYRVLGEKEIKDTKTTNGNNKVFKGASFLDSPIFSISGSRRGLEADSKSVGIGFRVALIYRGEEDAIEKLKK
jgi:formylglycine-generating enzyme required for sulfatase activity